MNQNVYDELNYQKVELRKSAKRAEYKQKKKRKAKERQWKRKYCYY